ncbi:MAG: hypothetical protein M3203_00770 [Actinomycetota bacterium]|nr:hypothetical protein [Actinomycetota bacterium]
MTIPTEPGLPAADEAPRARADGADPERAPELRTERTVGEDFAFLFDHRYPILGAVVVLLVVSYVAKGAWAGGVDIWEHAAAARELAARPFDPRHPLLAGVDAPHQFFSPYHLALGMLSRVTGLSIIAVFNIASVANVVLLVVGLRLFVNGLGLRRHTDFWALVFMLLLWGPGAWVFSGFHHFDVLPLVSSYPSTFAKGAVFVALWAHLKFLRSGNHRWLLPTLAISFVIILAHPVNAVGLGVGVLALAWTIPDERRDRALVLTVAVLGASMVLAVLWPYYSVTELLFGAGQEAFRAAGDAGDADMYKNVPSRLALALVVFPFVYRRLQAWRRDPLVLMFVGLIAAYLYGYFTEDWSFGRLIASAQIVASIILAEERAVVGEMAAALGELGRPLQRWVQVTTAALVLAGLFFLRNGFDVLPERLVGGAPYHWVHGYVDPVEISDFAYLREHGRTYPVVISDLYTSLEVPTFGPKVLEVARAQAFVDTSERGSDQSTFYDPATTNETRRQIIAKHGVTLLIIATVDLADEKKKLQPLFELGREVARNRRFVYVDLRGR